jgi:hypothetical protein
MVIGPIRKTKIQPVIWNNPSYFQAIQAKVKGTTEWIPVLDHPSFQRRKKERESENASDQSDTFYLLKEGQKIGPLPLSLVQKKVNSGEVLYTDYISSSSDGGWKKIYEYSEFDRRTKPEKLPSTPESDIFAGSKVEAVRSLKNRKNSYEDELINLSRLSENRPTSAKIPSNNNHSNKTSTEIRPPAVPKVASQLSLILKSIVTLTVFFGLMALAVYYFDLKYSTPKLRTPASKSASQKKDSKSASSVVDRESEEASVSTGKRRGSTRSSSYRKKAAKIYSRRKSISQKKTNYASDRDRREREFADEPDSFAEEESRTPDKDEFSESDSPDDRRDPASLDEEDSESDNFVDYDEFGDDKSAQGSKSRDPASEEDYTEDEAEYY